MSNSTNEERARYAIERLDELHKQIRRLVDVAEELLGALDEMERVVARAEWTARKMPARNKGLGKSKK